MIISGQHPMNDKKSKYILSWIQEITKIRPELGNFSICPYASGANFSIQEQKLSQITPNDDFDVIIYVVEDNLVKGASGQAVQAMNIMFGIKETTGLELTSLIP